MQPTEWTSIVAHMGNLWPGEKLAAESINEWFRVLRKYDVNAVTRAIYQLSTTEKFRPSIAQIRELCKGQEAKTQYRLDGDRAAEGLLPDGCVAVIKSQYQDTAVMGTAPWRLSDCNLPDNIAITRIDGVQPVDLVAAA